MKKLINILATFVLGTSSSTYLVQKYVTDFQTTKYTEESQHYSINEQNSTAFKQWASPSTGADSWDSYFKAHQHINANTSNIPGLDPGASVGGGFYLNIANEGLTKPAFTNSAVTNQTKTGNAIGAYNFGEYHESDAKIDDHRIPPPSNPPTFIQKFFHTTANGGYETGNEDFAVNNLNPNNKVNAGVTHFLEGYLNAELNYWYYSNFRDVLNDLPDYYANLKNYTALHNFLETYLVNLLIFTFGGQYQSAKTTYTPNAYSPFEKTLGSLLVDAAGEALGPEGWLASWAVDNVLDHYLDGETKRTTAVNHSFNWQSQPFSPEKIDNLFNEILGTDKAGKITLPSNSVIKKFLQNNNGQYPDSLTIKNFQFNVKNYSASHSFDDEYTWEANWPIAFKNGWGLKTDDDSSTSYDLSKITPEFDFDVYADKASPTYSSEKKVLDNPIEADKGDPLNIGQTTAKEWDQGLAINDINNAWEYDGGLTSDLENDVVYKQVLAPGQKTQPVLHQKPLRCEMYFKDGLLGYTQNHPRYFYVEGN